MILFLHGIGGWRKHWDAQVAFFSKKFMAAAWDARGYGDSDDYDGPLDFSVFSRDLVRVLEHFKVERMHLVGLSMGGRIARNFALQHPDRLKSLVLANTTPGFDALSPEEVRRFVEERKKRSAEGLPKLLGSRFEPSALEALKQSFAAVREPSYLKTLEASVSQDRAAAIENIRIPTLVITGSEDKVYAPQIARDMARRIPGAELAVLEGAGHLTNLEQPGHFNRLVLEFALKQETRA